MNWVTSQHGRVSRIASSVTVRLAATAKTTTVPGLGGGVEPSQTWIEREDVDLGWQCQREQLPPAPQVDGDQQRSP